MGKQQPATVFMPPNVLKAKVEAAGGFDPSAVKRAELAMEELREEFAGWIAIDVTHLVEARDAFNKSRGAGTLGALYRAAHDLRGQGATFDFPLVARMAASLCQLTDVEGDGKEIPMPLIDAHVDAIRVVVRQAIKDKSNKTASVLVVELERRVAEFQA
jgi:Hpt domain